MIVILVADGVSHCREGYAVVYTLSYPISCCVVAVKLLVNYDKSTISYQFKIQDKQITLL